METEEKIVWSIINTINERANQDMNIGERIIRTYLRVYRAAVIAESTMKGILIPDECFQHYKTETFNYVSPKLFSAVLPKIILLQNNAGIYFEKNGEIIPIVNSESFSLSMKNFMFKHLPKAKIVGEKATIYVGQTTTLSCGDHPENNEIITDFNQEILDNNNAFVTADIFAVLNNPADADGYDWTSSIYPLSAELLAEVRERIFKLEFNIILQNETDNVTNGIEENN